MKGAYDRFLDKGYRGRDASELTSAPVEALYGVSPGDAARLREAFGIVTIADLAANPFVAAAQVIAAAASGRAHDPGPDADWETFFASTPLDAYQAHPDAFRLDFGPVWYRGRLDGTARLLVVGQDPAPNELVGHRIFVGSSGQRVQGFLRKLGLARDYLMVNTFIYPIFGQFRDVAGLSRSEPLQGFRNAFLDRITRTNPLEAILAVGSAAADALEHWPGLGDIPVCHIAHPSARDPGPLLASWNTGLVTLRSLIDPELGQVPDLIPYGADWMDADEAPIPRRDLPFGVPDWHGVGDHATRGTQAGGRSDPKAIVWTAP